MVVTIHFTNYYSKYGKIWVFTRKMAPKWSKSLFLAKKACKIAVSTRKRCLYANSPRRGRGGEVNSIFWNFFSNSSTFFWKKCHFWRPISRDLGLPNGSNYPFWVGKCFLYAPLFDADTWKCTVLELWALEVGLKSHFFWKLRKPLIFEGTYTKNWAIYGGQTCFEV